MPDIYLNTAAFGLIDTEAMDEAGAVQARLARLGSRASEAWRAEEEPRIRASIAALLGTEDRQIALVPNSSWALNAVAGSLRGDERVLLYRGDYPSLLEPFRMRGLPIRWVGDKDGFALPTEEIYRAIGQGEVDLVAISQVQYNSGYRTDIEALGSHCRRHGVKLIVDATQSLGALPLSGAQADLVIASSYKWLRAGAGTGILYASGAFLEQYPPVVGGNNSYTLLGDVYAKHLPIRAYEPGHANIYGFTLLGRCAEHLLERGIDSIGRYNAALMAPLLEYLSGSRLPLIGPATEEHRAPILVFHNRDGLSDALRAADIIATFRGGKVRISLHHYNTAADVAALTDCLRRHERSGAVGDSRDPSKE